jgi:transglutaminase-like putative cysteine protease
MFRPICRLYVSIRAGLIAVAIGGTFATESAAQLPPSNQESAHRLAAELSGSDRPKYRLPLTSDSEHARSLDPVLTPETAVWIHEALPAGPLTVVNGRAFTYSDAAYDPLDAPVLKIRPIDDDQTVPFLLRIVISPRGRVSSDAAAKVTFPVSPIFTPSLDISAARVGSQPVETEIEADPAQARITLRVPLLEIDADQAQAPNSSMPVILMGELHLGAYSAQSENRFLDEFRAPLDPEIADLSTLKLGRDIGSEQDRETLLEIAELLKLEQRTPFGRVAAVNSWVSNFLQYQESPVTRSPVEAIEDRSGDCDEHAALMTALLRALGIPARLSTGLLYDFDVLAAHTWVEAAVPTRDNELHWFLCDPTLAATTLSENQKARFVQIKDRVYSYPIRPTISLEGMAGTWTSDLLINWRRRESEAISDPADPSQFVDLVTQEVDRQISRGADRLAEAGLMLRRRSTSIPGSPYFLVDRPVAEGSSSRLQLRLENEERLVLELSAEAGSALESESDQEFVSRFRKVYEELNVLFFSGEPAHANLELAFSRDRHTDRLQSVSLRSGRFIVENYLDRILGKLEKHDLLTADEATRVNRGSEVSGGVNLYILQELARRRAETD